LEKTHFKIYAGSTQNLTYSAKIWSNSCKRRGREEREGGEDERRNMIRKRGRRTWRGETEKYKGN
jgi:hypothetical protein